MGGDRAVAAGGAQGGCFVQEGSGRLHRHDHRAARRHRLQGGEGRRGQDPGDRRGGGAGDDDRDQVRIRPRRGCPQGKGGGRFQRPGLLVQLRPQAGGRSGFRRAVGPRAAAAAPRVGPAAGAAARDYFAGQWKFKWLGRDSPLSTGGPREGTATFRPVADGKFLELVTEGKSESGAYRELGYLGYDSEKKSVTLFEARGNGIALLCVGDWSSPVSIRFSVAPVQAGGQTLRLKRTINVVAAHSWTMVEELSVDGGPFQRLGNAIYTKVGAEGAKE
ncbi:MAG: hypothetical protein DMG07_17005 [Acidobacteria bacterium]|nr:MAG: hypothetical protein DMG07_17005 [Acidobacteriota bacterium]